MQMRKLFTRGRVRLGSLVIATMFTLAACTGPQGSQGPQGPAGPPGPTASGTAQGSNPMTTSVTNWRFVNEWPFNAPLPEHLFVDLGDGTPLFLHFDKPVTAPDKKLLWVGTGERARFYLEEQPNAAYTHFHRFRAPTADAGHGGPPGAEGYWLIHAAITSFKDAMMDRAVERGADFGFMPTKAPATNPEAKLKSLPASATGWKWRVEWPFDAPLPEHEWLDLGNGKILFLHYDKPVSASDKKLLFIGLGIRGRFCSGEEPGPAFAHFHRLNAPNPDAGHGGPPGAEGYWLAHVAVQDMTMDGRQIKAGVDFQFMPTRAPRCGAAS